MLLVFDWAKQILKIARDFEPALWRAAVRGEPVFPYLSALRAAESVGQKSESLILVELYNSARTFFERN